MHININFEDILKLVHLGLTSNKNNRFITYICKHQHRVIKISTNIHFTERRNNTITIMSVYLDDEACFFTGTLSSP
jgi:hypothetical protein